MVWLELSIKVELSISSRLLQFYLWLLFFSLVVFLPILVTVLSFCPTMFTARAKHSQASCLTVCWPNTKSTTLSVSPSISHPYHCHDLVFLKVYFYFWWLFLTKLSFVLTLYEGKSQGRCSQFKLIWDLWITTVYVRNGILRTCFNKVFMLNLFMNWM